MLLTGLMTSGDTVLADMLTYPGMKAAAAHAGVRLVGVEGDKSGMLPDALERAIGRHKPKAVYLIPTIHNPTAITIPLVRRRSLVEVLRKSNLTLIEDDAYGLLEPEAIPMANLAPELTYLAASVSKCMAPGLRVSFLLTPTSQAADSVIETLRAFVQMTPPLTLGIVVKWLRDGSADEIVAAIRAEAAGRQKLAAQILSKHRYHARPNGHHIWLPLPDRWTSLALVANAQQRGLAIVGSETFLVGGKAPNAVRLALGAATSRHELGSALGLLLTSLDAPARANQIV
jgi:DNA-binding transcriptional MocR family regulator